MLYLLYQGVELSNDSEADALVNLSMKRLDRGWIVDLTVCSTVELHPPMKQCYSSCTHHSTDFSDTCFLLGDSTITIFTLTSQTYSNC